MDVTPSVPGPREPAASRLAAIGPELLVGMATVLALLLGLHELDRRALWLDEATSFYVSGVRWSRLAELLSTGAEGWHPPTYFIALKLWRYLGDSQTALRSLSLVFAVLSVPAIFLVARQLTLSRWVAAVAALLLACNAYFVRYAQEARTYALTMFLATVSYLLFLRALESGTHRRWIAYVAVSLLGIYSHIFFALVVAAQYASLALPGLRPRSWRAPLIALAAIGLLTIPLVAASIGQAGSLANWIKPMGWSTLVTFFHEYAGDTLPAALAHGAALLVALAWAIGPGRDRSWVWTLVIWAFLPPLGLAAASLVKPLFVNRYLIVMLPALVILVAVGITRLPRLPAAALLGVVLVTSGFALSNWYADPYKPWDRLARHLAARGSSRDGLALWSDALKPLAFQVNHLGLRRAMPVLVSPPRPWSFNPYRFAGRQVEIPAGEQFLACEFERIWLVGGPETLGERETGRQEDIYRILTASYEERRDIRRGNIHLELFVRNDEPCPAAPEALGTSPLSRR